MVFQLLGFIDQGGSDLVAFFEYAIEFQKGVFDEYDGIINPSVYWFPNDCDNEMFVSFKFIRSICIILFLFRWFLSPILCFFFCRTIIAFYTAIRLFDILFMYVFWFCFSFFFFKSTHISLIIIVYSLWSFERYGIYWRVLFYFIYFFFEFSSLNANFQYF